MPMSAVVVALVMRLFGDHYLRVAWFKTLLFLLPTIPFRWGFLACLAAYLWADSSTRGGYEVRVLRFGLLLAVLA